MVQVPRIVFASASTRPANATRQFAGKRTGVHEGVGNTMITRQNEWLRDYSRPIFAYCYRLVCCVLVLSSLALLSSCLASPKGDEHAKASAALVGLWTNHLPPKVAVGTPAVNQVKAALDKGADPNARDRYGNSVLQYACSNGHLAIVKLLVSAGASVNAVQPPGNVTALSWSVAWPDCIRFLLSKGAKVNATDFYGMTAFLYAAKHGPVASLRILAANGADVHAVSKIGGTALMSAASQGQLDNVKYLIAKGCCDINAKDKMGETALTLAEKCPQERAETVAALKAAGAK